MKILLPFLRVMIVILIFVLLLGQIGQCQNSKASNSFSFQTNTAATDFSLAARYKTLWTSSVEDGDSSPIVSEGVVYKYHQGVLTAFDIETGSVKWAWNPPQVGQDLKNQGSYSIFAPVLAYHTIFISVASQNVGFLYAIDVRTGKQKWCYTSGTVLARDPNRGPIWSRPVLWYDRLTFRTNRGLTAVLVKDGSEIWNQPTDEMQMVGRMLPYPSGTPACDKHAIYFNSDFGFAYAFDLYTGRNLWKIKTHGITDTTSNSIHKVALTVTTCAPLLFDDKLLIADGKGNAYALQKSNGKILWQNNLGSIFQFGSVKKNVYIASKQGFFQIDPLTGKILKQRLNEDGIWKCLVSQHYAILATAPYKKFGWEIFDLTQWKTVWRDDTFVVREEIAVADGTVVLGGIAADKTPDPTFAFEELRAYVPDTKQ